MFSVALLALLGGYSWVNPLRTEHVAMLGAAASFWLFSRTARSFLAAFLPFFAFSWIYDLLRIFADSAASRALVAQIYRAEAALFQWSGIAPGWNTLNDWLASHHRPWLDVLAGGWYASHVATIIMLGTFLWGARHWRPERFPDASLRLERFMWGFLLLNLGMFAINLALPVAPPWFVAKYGGVMPDVIVGGDPAGLARLDQLFGVPYFASVYSKSAYVFGSMPSGHTAYAVWFALNLKHPLSRSLGAVYAIVMAFFALYLGHHYVADVVAGTILALVAYALSGHLSVRTQTRRIQAAVDRLFVGATGSAAGAHRVPAHAADGNN